MIDTKEMAIGGVTTGLMRLGETVQWKAKHFGVHFTMTMEIIDLVRPSHFTDEMIQGPFKQARHKHIFELTSDAFDKRPGSR
jgi:ligand-binding SRPBCC domain-containing protein